LSTAMKPSALTLWPTILGGATLQKGGHG
jgi:hypothetical protein